MAHSFRYTLMKYALTLLLLLFGALTASAQPDTVKTGIYITSIHDINFKDKEYSLNAWVWFRYRNKDFNFNQNLEIPQAKTFTKSYTTIDSGNGEYYILMKLECIMKDSWKIDHFPFDRQVLRFSVENAQFGAESLVFKTDDKGQNHGKFTVSGWTIDSFLVSTGIKTYETAFGDPEYEIARTEYGTFKVKIGMLRDAWGLFWKMFLGMYVSFCIAITCLFIHADNIDSRLGLSVGSLFTAIGNKYIIDSALPESSSFTLVDMLHSITLLSIFAVIGISVYALKLRKKNNLLMANRIDKYSAWVLIGLYVFCNAFFILAAAFG